MVWSAPEDDALFALLGGVREPSSWRIMLRRGLSLDRQLYERCWFFNELLPVMLRLGRADGAALARVSVASIEQ
jgi:hypothetical protein